MHAPPSRARSPHKRRPYVLVSLSLALACGPVVDSESEGATDGDASTEGSSAGASTDATTGATTDSATGTTGVEFEGLSIELASHSYICIDGCYGYYSTDRLRLELVSETDRELEIAWYSWTLTDAELKLGEFPIDVELVSLQAGELTEVDLTEERDGFCSMSDWQDPMRALITIDDVPVELAGLSNGSFGWDC